MGFKVFGWYGAASRGLGLMAWGILGSENLSRQYDTSVDIGEEIEIGGFKIEGQQRNMSVTASRTEIYLFDVLVSEPDGSFELLTPDLEFFPKLNTLYARPAIDSDLSGDVQVIINEWESSFGQGVGIRINVQPYIAWLWIGGLVMGLGGAILLLLAESHTLQLKLVFALLVQPQRLFSEGGKIHTRWLWNRRRSKCRQLKAGGRKSRIGSLRILPTWWFS